MQHIREKINESFDAVSIQWIDEVEFFLVRFYQCVHALIADNAVNTLFYNMLEFHHGESI